MLSATQREELRIVIREQMRQLEDQISTLNEKIRPIAPDCSLGRLTRLEAMGEKQVNETVLRESELRLTRLKNALLRIDREEFGQCIECGEPIPVERLKIRPESLKCIECAE
jgi:DnaK suppressor protein